LQDVTGGVAKDGEEAKEIQCCICLGNIVKGKQL